MKEKGFNWFPLFLYRTRIYSNFCRQVTKKTPQLLQYFFFLMFHDQPFPVLLRVGYSTWYEAENSKSSQFSSTVAVDSSPTTAVCFHLSTPPSYFNNCPLTSLFSCVEPNPTCGVKSQHGWQLSTWRRSQVEMNTLSSSLPVRHWRIVEMKVIYLNQKDSNAVSIESDNTLLCCVHNQAQIFFC